MAMKHRKGINLVGANGDTGYTVGEGSRRSSSTESDDRTYRVEVWTEAPQSGGEMLETISRATDFSVICGALKAAVRQRPGKVLVHLNGRHRMSCEIAPDPPVPEHQRPLGRRERPRNQRTRRRLRRWNSGTFSVPVVLCARIKHGSTDGSLDVVSAGSASSPR